jgi:hypothetical protein
MSSFNTVGQYTANHKPWDHTGNITPVSEKSEGFRPWLEAMPAAWLPVQFWEKFYENWIVAMPGKIVSADPQGRIVPAQYMLATSTVTYATNDVNAGTIDVRNGNACTAASVSASPITLSGVAAWMGVTGLTWATKQPIGVAMYPYLQWAGDGSTTDDGWNPAAYRFHNYNMQHRVTLVCDYMLELPVVPASTTSETVTAGARTLNVQVLGALSNLPVAAHHATRSPISFADGTLTNSATMFVTQKATLAAVVSAGDWFIDLVTGIISFYTTTTQAGNYIISYYNYASAPGTVSVFASAVGNLRGGDFLKCDANSNWTIATPKVFGDGVTDDFDTFTSIMGQILEVQTEPKDYLERVRTAWSSLGTDGTGALPGTATGGQMDQMPGTATGGASLAVHYAGASNLVALVNLVSR